MHNPEDVVSGMQYSKMSLQVVWIQYLHLLHLIYWKECAAQCSDQTVYRGECMYLNCEPNLHNCAAPTW